MKSEAFLMDCMEGMKNTPDKYYDLAVVDPPYGIGVVASGKIGSGSRAKAKDYGAKEWDKQPPSDEYFSQLRRVSKNQIVWGANHFISKLPFDSSCWLVWDKDNSGDYADCELAWTSFDTAVRKFMWRWSGMRQQNMKQKEIRIHPTQKPVALYDWIFNKYATPGMKILDTHLGSGSSRIAAYKAKLDFTGYEIDPEYFEAQEKRFQIFIAQGTLF